ncbi:MAG: YjbQ family protein [Candidatus Heimdallarchaeota archaeon]|nr:YjbQ family protein [Candidatus Heimdallarchaeota archaeon]MCK4770782.1 secondary thiamine-phosphate synthase enzyme YjbQ [Candidatus Heimdallarchaeota archaeon]
MQVFAETLQFQTEGEIDIVDLTHELDKLVSKSGIKEGMLTANVIGSTGALTAIEFESGVLDDFRKMLEKLVPKGAGYKHDKIDSNAHSHLRASLLGPSLSLAINNGRLQLGTWQQPVFVCLDVRPRSRRIAIIIVGE